MTHYETLGCHPASTPEEIKQSYYKSARKYHPDKNDGRDEDFKKAVQAYTVLSDPKKKSEYDRSLPYIEPQIMRIRLEEFLTGGERRFQFTEDVWLNQNGELARPIVCPQCHRGNPFFVCPLCRGSRQVYPGYAIKAQREQTLQVTIPPKSWPGRTIYAGRIPIILRVISPSGQLNYVDDILYYYHRVHIFRALLGLDEELTILGEKHHLLHPEPILTSSEIIIPGAGLHRSTGERGPLSILFQIEFPKALDADQRRLLSECLECEAKKLSTS